MERIDLGESYLAHLSGQLRRVQAIAYCGSDECLLCREDSMAYRTLNPADFVRRIEPSRLPNVPREDFRGGQIRAGQNTHNGNRSWGRA